MVQILPAKPSFGERFSQAFTPAFGKGMERFLEEEQLKEREARKLKADEVAEQRKIANQKATAKALGLPEVAMEPSVQAALLKEQAKDKRNQQLLQALGINIPSEPQAPGMERLLGEEGMAPDEGMTKEAISQFKPGDITDDQVTIATILNPQLGSTLQRQQEAARKELHTQEKNLRQKFESDRDFEWKRAGDILKKTDEVRDVLDEKRTAANLIKQTAASGNTSGWAPWFADVLGVEPLRNADSALLKSAGKDFFINNLAKAGSRPNQWIEQQISDAMVKIGRDQTSNMIVADLMEYWVDREAEKVRLIDQLEDEDMAEVGYVRGNIGKRASERMKDWEDKRRDQLIYQIQQTKEQQNPDELAVIREVPKGTPLTREKARIFKQRYGADAEKAARKAGYDVEIFARIS